MHRYALPISILALAGAIVFATLQPAVAADTKEAFCMDAAVARVKGDDPTHFAAGATILMNRMITDFGHRDFITLKHGDVAVLCGWRNK